MSEIFKKSVNNISGGSEMKLEELPKQERPRERLLKYGKEYLSNEELLSIILKCGTTGKSVKELSLEILNQLNSIQELQDITIEKLSSIRGIGKIKAIEIIASIELGKRIFLEKVKTKPKKVTNADQIYQEMKYLFYRKKQEYFYCLYFNNKQELIERKLLFMGTINRSIVHPREVFKSAYLNSASSIICVHNHPSNDINPSREDIHLTKQLVEIGKINGIPITDHIIMTDDGYYSFYEQNRIDY